MLELQSVFVNCKKNCLRVYVAVITTFFSCWSGQVYSLMCVSKSVHIIATH